MSVEPAIPVARVRALMDEATRTTRSPYFRQRRFWRLMREAVEAAEEVRA